MKGKDICNYEIRQLDAPHVSRFIPKYSQLCIHAPSKRGGCIAFTNQNYVILLAFFCSIYCNVNIWNLVLGALPSSVSSCCFTVIVFNFCYLLLTLAQPVLRIGSKALHQPSPILGVHSSRVLASASICACAVCGVAGGFRANIRVVCTRRRFASGSPPCMSAIGAPRRYKTSN